MLFKIIKRSPIFQLCLQIPIYLLVLMLQILYSCNTAAPDLDEMNEQDSESDQNIFNLKRIPFPEPRSHKTGWIFYHGNIIDLMQRENACYTCHHKRDCISCHSTQLPRDHKNTWRTRNHGLTASVGRERCNACHKQDYCVRCHNETAPRSHRGNWESRHCNWCHFGSSLVSVDNCSVCHRKALHQSAPHRVNTKLNCMDCH